MNKFTTVLFATLFALSTTAYADEPATYSEGSLTACWISAEEASEQVCPESPPVPVCEPAPKPKPKKRKWKKRKKKKIVPPAPCRCEPGPKGDKGDKGNKGDTGIIEIVHTVERAPHEHNAPGFQLGLGWMGSSYWPENDYAWSQGPSLRLTSSLKGDHTTNLELGWAPGRDGGLMLRATLTDWDWIDDRDWLGFGGGLFVQAIGTDEDRDQGHYVGFLPEVSLRHDFGPILVSANVGPSLAYTNYDDERNTKGFVLGVVGSAGLSLDF